MLQFNHFLASNLARGALQYRGPARCGEFKPRLLCQRIARLPISIGQRVALIQGVEKLAAGESAAAGALVELQGLDMLRLLVETKAPPAALWWAIDTAILERYRELPAFIAANGGRPAFTRWCQQAECAAPDNVPEILDIYRGTMGCSPTAAAAGLHWSLNFDDAASYACRFADEHLTGVIVLHARIRRDEVACFVHGTAHAELIPADVPAKFEVITDHVRIGEAAVRDAHRLQALKAGGGWSETGSRGEARRAAMAIRTRMTVAGITPGTAVVSDLWG